MTQPVGPTVTPAPQRKSRAVWWVLGAIIGLVLCGGIAAIVAGIAGSDTGAGGNGRPIVTATRTGQPPVDNVPPVENVAVPKTTDFKLTVKTLRKQCFGSAGCNINYRIVVAVVGSPPDASKTYELTYEVRGGESPQVNTLTVTGTEYQVQEEEFISTKSSKNVLTAVVTSVSEQ